MALMRLRALCDKLHVARQKDVGVGLVLVAADAAAELVEIAQAEPVGAVDDDGVGVGNIEAALDDRGADEHVDLAFDEPVHDVFEFVFAHLAVADIDAECGLARIRRSKQLCASRSATASMLWTRLCRK